MRIEFQYFDECPNWQVTYDRLVEAVAINDADGEDVEIAMTEVATAEDASRIGFRGSPSIVINGLDLFSHEPASAEGSLSCRFYASEDGAPSVSELIEAIEAMRPRT